MKKIIYTLTILLIITACSRKEELIPGDKIIILNNVGNTVDIYSVEEDSLYMDMIKTGDVPNYMVIDEDRGYIINSGGISGTPSISVIDMENWEVEQEIPMPQGSNPWAGVLVKDTLYITSYGLDKVYLFDIKENKIVDSIDVGKKPEGILYDGERIYIACTGINPDFTYSDGYLYVINGKDVEDSVQVGKNPQYIIDGGDVLYVICTGDYKEVSGKVYIVDKDNLMVKDSINTGGTPGYGIKRENYLYITDYSGYLYRIDTETKEIKKIETGTGTTWITCGDDKLWISVSPYNETNYLKTIREDRVEKEIELGEKGAGFIMYLSQ